MFADVAGSNPAVFATNGGGEGFGGGGAWLIAILFLAFAGRGFGGGCGGEGIRNEVDFAQVNDRIDNVNAMAEQRATYKEAYDTHMSILESKSDILSSVKDNQYNTLLALKDMQAANAACCCETQRSIDSVKFENAQNTCAITTAIQAEGNATRAMIQGYEYQRERDGRMAAESKIALLEQNAYITNALGQKPPVAAYITCNPNQTTFPVPVATNVGGCCGNAYGYAC